MQNHPNILLFCINVIIFLEKKNHHSIQMNSLMSRAKTYFSEDNGDWQSIPAWVNFLIRFGYCWKRSNPEGRRVALMSMPCSTPGAGLIALGALISDLGRIEANDLDTHNDVIFDYARQYLEYCKDCTLSKCDPKIKRCGFDSKSLGAIRSVRRKNIVYRVSEETNCNERKLIVCENRNPSVKTEIDRKYLINLYVDGEPPAVALNAETGLQGSVYQGLIEEAQIYPPNLRQSYSGLVLAGRAKGISDTKNAYEAVHFSTENESYTLRELLAIHGWSDSKVCRTAFFNARTKDIAQTVTQPRLVVADGDSSFLKSVDTFRKSDVIGVLDRSLDRDRLEVIGQKISALKSWYEPDKEFQAVLPFPVPGISITILKKS
jgi:hypothetical protein